MMDFSFALYYKQTLVRCAHLHDKGCLFLYFTHRCPNVDDKSMTIFFLMRRCSREVACDRCDARFGTESSLRCHKRRKHPETSTAQQLTLEQKATVVCGICRRGFTSQLDLCEHLEEDESDGGHGIPAAVEEFVFEAEEDFQTWKMDVEREGCVRFVQRSTKMRGAKDEPKFLVRYLR